MKIGFFHSLSRMLVAFAGLVHVHFLEPMARRGDQVLTFGLGFLDNAFPMAAVAGDIGHAMVPTREVTFLTRGLHRLAQPVLRRGPASMSGDEDEPALDNGMIGGAARIARAA